MASGLLLDYMGTGPIASRPASPTLHTGTLGLWYADDTGVLSAWDGSAWADVGPGGGGAVDSVNGHTGVVVLDLDDLGDVDATSPTDGYSLAWDGTASKWKPAAPSVGMSNPMSASGDVIYGGASGAPTRLAAGTDGHVLTLVSGVPAWAAAGGGGLTNWSEGVSTASPNTVIPVIYFTAASAALNADSAIVAKGYGATLAQVPDGTSAGGNKRGNYATDWQKSRSAPANVAGGTNSTISGGFDNRAAGTSATIGGGQSNTIASGSYSTICGGSSNSSTVNTTFIGGGSSNVASGVSIGGSAIAGGHNNTADGDYSWIPGGHQGNARMAHGAGARAAGRFSASGDAQSRVFVMRAATSNATQTTLTCDGLGATSTNQVVLPNNSSFVVKGSIVGRQNSTGDAAGWEFTAIIRRGANAASTAMVVACTPSLVGADTGAAAWAVAVDADNSNGGLRVRVTGEAAKSIKWVCDVFSCLEVVG